MAAAHLLGLEIRPIMVIGAEGEREALGDGDAVALDRGDFVRIIGQQPDPGEAQLAQHLGRGLVDALIRFETQLLIGIDRVETGILQALEPLRRQDRAGVILRLGAHPGQKARIGTRVYGGLRQIACLKCMSIQNCSYLLSALDIRSDRSQTQSRGA